MAKRKRKHVSLKQRLARAFWMLLPQTERDILRGARAPAEVVLARFEFHHVVPHCAPFNGSDAWWNLDAMPKKTHRARSKGMRSDTSIIAKVKRLRQSPQAIAGKPKPKVGKTTRVGRGSTTEVHKRSRGAPGLRPKADRRGGRAE